VKILDYHKPDAPRRQARPLFRVGAALCATGGLLAAIQLLREFIVFHRSWSDLVLLGVVLYAVTVLATLACVGRPLWLLRRDR